jgi:hypothetical protein
VLRFADHPQGKQSDEDNRDEAKQVTPMVPEEEDQDSEGDEIHAAVISKEKVLNPGDYEVVAADGSITVIRGEKQFSNEEIESEDAHVINAAKADKRFDKLTAHRRLRFKDILDRGVGLCRS